MLGLLRLVPVVLLVDGLIAEMSLFVLIGVGDRGCWVIPCNADSLVVDVVVAPAVAGLDSDDPVIRIVKTVVLMLNILPS